MTLEGIEVLITKYQADKRAFHPEHSRDAV
jgi:hypothetical protein